MLLEGDSAPGFLKTLMNHALAMGDEAMAAPDSPERAGDAAN